MQGKKGTAQPDQSLVKAKAKRIETAKIIVPEVEDSTSRQKALDDPIFFIEHCCKSTLRHKLPPALKDFALQVVQSAKQGGNVLVVLPRGSGKTTILQDALLYCIVAGIVHFPVLVAANQTAANAILRNIWKIVETSQELHECFPELTQPVREINGQWQRCSIQNVDGKPTNIKVCAGEVHFADMGDKKGATIVARGAGSSVRGLLAADGTRPDWVICDDLQKSSTARSSTQLEKLERYVLEDIRGLSGGDSTISVFIAATPLAPNDIVDRLGKRSDIVTIKKPLISHWPTHRELWEDYTNLLYGDLAEGTSKAHDFYLSRKDEMDEGAEMLDPLAHPPTMASALERAYYLRATMGEEAFRQEYLLTPPTPRESLSLDPVEVSKRLSHVPHRVVPKGCSALVASIDVGTATALHVVVNAYGRHQLGTTIDGYRFPDEGRLVPKGVPQEVADRALAKALVGVITNLVAPGRYRMEGTGRPVPITAIAIDRGFRTSIVDSVAAYFLRRGISVFPCKGHSNPQYRQSKYTIAKAENVDLRDFNDGSPRWLGYNADTLKVIAMQAFKGEPLTTGALSLWGSDSAKVFPIAQEIAGEKLLESFDTKAGTVYRWAMAALGAQNHFLDCEVLNLALATWLRFRQPDSLTAVIKASPSIETKPEPTLKAQEERKPTPKALPPQQHGNKLKLTSPFAPRRRSIIKLK